MAKSARAQARPDGKASWWMPWWSSNIYAGNTFNDYSCPAERHVDPNDDDENPCVLCWSCEAEINTRRSLLCDVYASVPPVAWGVTDFFERERL